MLEQEKKIAVATPTEVATTTKKLVKTKTKASFGKNLKGESIMDIDRKARTVKFDLRSERGHVINKLKTLVGLGKVPFKKEERTFVMFESKAKEHGKVLTPEMQDLVKTLLKPENVELYNENRDGGSVEFKF